MRDLFYEFDCGCRVPIIDNTIKPNDNLPSMRIDYDNLNLDCGKTWDLIGTGQTKGVFQLESEQGQNWAEKIKPRSVDEISVLSAVLRPGSLHAIVDGKSMTQHYADRKFNREEVEYFHNALKPILENTLGILVFQEQALKIAKEIAGFDLVEANLLRKAIGKKKPEIMAKVKKQFLDGCKKTKIVSESDAETIFGWIQESQRYQFNASHSLSYGIEGYWCAWVKHHFPLHFYTAWLHYSSEKMDPQEEVLELVMDTKNFGVKINPPSFPLIKTSSGVVLNNDNIYFGLQDIKGIGQKRIDKTFDIVEKIEKEIGKDIRHWTWFDILSKYSIHSTKTVINGLIESGALSHTHESRSKMAFEYNVWSQLTKKEKEDIAEKKELRNLEDALHYLQYERPKTNVRRIKKIQDLSLSMKDPSYSQKDSPTTIINNERRLLGVPLTFTDIDVFSCRQGNTTCKEFRDGKKGDMSIVCEIIRAKPWTNKKGKQMCFLSIADNTGSVNSVTAFTETWKKYKSLLYTGNIVMVIGKQNVYNGQKSFVINKVVGL